LTYENILDKILQDIVFFKSFYHNIGYKMPSQWENQLYFGDNLDILREHIPDESVDLIYLDPPFNSKATYNVLFKEQNGSQSTAQITAFEDTWHWGLESEKTYKEGSPEQEIWVDPKTGV